jgi:hypothetical protein
LSPFTHFVSKEVQITTPLKILFLRLGSIIIELIVLGHKIMNLKTFKTKTPKEAALGREVKHVFSVPPKCNCPLSLQPNFFSSFPNQ